MALCNLHFNCSRGSCAHPTVSCPGSPVVPSGAVGRAGTLEPAPPFWARSWHSLRSARVHGALRADVPGWHRRAPHLPPPAPSSATGPARREGQEAAGGARLPGCGRLGSAADAPELQQPGPFRTRRPPPGPRRRPQPAPASPAAHKYSPRPRGRQRASPRASGLTQLPPRGAARGEARTRVGASARGPRG